MNKKLLLTLMAILATCGAQAKLRINNQSGQTMYLWISSSAGDRNRYVEIPSSNRSYSAMDSEELRKYTYLHDGTFDGINWFQVDRNGKTTYYSTSISTKLSAIITHLTIQRDGSYTHKGGAGVAKKSDSMTHMRVIGSE
jgi:hypothetical protein